jgi:hypothetical protein
MKLKETLPKRSLLTTIVRLILTLPMVGGAIEGTAPPVLNVTNAA